MKYITSLLIGSSVAFAGGSQGGGTPPAREQLELLLNTDREFSNLDGGLFDNGAGDIGLLTRGKLQPQMLVSGGSSGGGTPPLDGMLGGGSGGGIPPALRLSSNDVNILRDRVKPIDAVGSLGQNLSFDVLAGETLDSVVLKDRREIARAAVKQ
ncbi:MAG TPA: hypothetical protein VFO10_02800 [Oligoflexus sp.]|uniref:hypothetical protein n=1 Tax=Oligoflexus sp. TaxID=1971216 RepID=UPI002D7F7E27|nr:hypothetical protein [Oligoflexus sp.]HET9236151.1 hypothetical protein [Oligoflexus sp.]